MKKIYARLITSVFIAFVIVGSVVAPVSAAENESTINEFVFIVQHPASLSQGGSSGIGSF